MTEIERNEKRKTMTDRQYELDWDTKGTKRTKRVQNQTELEDKKEGEKAGITKRKMSRQTLSHQSEVRKNRKVRKAEQKTIRLEKTNEDGLRYWKNKFSEMVERNSGTIFKIKGVKEHIMRVEKGRGKGIEETATEI